MINFHCTIIPVVVLDSVITHTSAWFLDGEIHQLVLMVVRIFVHSLANQYTIHFKWIHSSYIIEIYTL